MSTELDVMRERAEKAEAERGFQMRRADNEARETAKWAEKAQTAETGRDVARLERDAALAALARVREWAEKWNGQGVPDWEPLEQALDAAPSNALAEHDAQVAARALGAVADQVGGWQPGGPWPTSEVRNRIRAAAEQEGGQ